MQYEPSISIAYSLSKPSLKLNEIKNPKIMNFSKIKSRYQHLPSVNKKVKIDRNVLQIMRQTKEASRRS